MGGGDYNNDEGKKSKKGKGKKTGKNKQRLMFSTWTEEGWLAYVRVFEPYVIGNGGKLKISN